MIVNRANQLGMVFPLLSTLALAAALAVAAPAGAFAQKTEPTPKTVIAPPTEHGKGASSSEKKPGKSCHGLDPGSQAFKDCIQKRAHEGDAGKGKGMNK